jgi:hypothetical protein
MHHFTCQTATLKQTKVESEKQDTVQKKNSIKLRRQKASEMGGPSCSGKYCHLIDVVRRYDLYHCATPCRCGKHASAVY